MAARRVIRVLALEPEHPDPAPRHAEPPPGSDLVDVASGLRVRAGRLVALVSDDPAETAAVADRLGRYADGEVRWGEVPLAGLPRDVVRRRIVVSDTGSTLFSGTLRDGIDVRGRGPGAVAAAVHAASAEDVLEALALGLDEPVAEHPLLLDRADEVAFLVHGRVVATGTHRRLLADEPRYRAVVTRDVEEVV